MKALLLILLMIASLNAKELEKVSVQLQWLDQFQFAGYYMAKEKGFYEDVGLEVEIKKHISGLKTINEVTSARATYGIGRPALIVDRSKGEKIVLLSALFQSSPLVLLALKKSNILSVKDFAHKKIMVSFNDVSVVSIQAMLARENISLSEMKIIPYSYDINELIDSKIDLMTAYITNQPYKLKELGVEYRMFDPRDYGFDIYADLLFTSEEEIKNHPQRAENFRDATLKGYKYAFEHIDETIALIKSQYNIQNKSYKALKYEAEESKKLAYYQTETLGKIDSNKIQRIYDMYNIMGLVDMEIDLNKFIFKNHNHKHEELNSEEEEYLAKKKEIRMCVFPNLLPYSKIENNKFIGMSADYIELVSNSIDTPFRLVETSSWRESVEFLQKRECDVLSITMQTDSYREFMSLTEIFFSVKLVIATGLDKVYVSDIKNMMEETFAITSAYPYIESLKKSYPNIKLIEVSNINEGLDKIIKNEAYGFIGDLASVAYEIQRKHSHSIKISGTIGGLLKAGIGVRSDDKVLLQILNKSVKSIGEKEVQTIYNNWISVNYENGVDYKLITNVSLVFILIVLIILFFLVRQGRLKRKIELLASSLEIRVKEEVEKNANKDKQLFYQSRLAQMGEMISMIAHQWRQPLGAIASTTIDMKIHIELESFDLKSSQGREECKEYFANSLNNIENFTQGLTKTIDEFRDFYKYNREKETLKVDIPIQKALNIVRTSLLTNDIEIQENYRATKKLSMLEGELIQVFLNILKNAEDNFKIKKMNNARIRIETKDTSEGVSIKIEDNGGGIDKSIVDKIFDPYFSTKNEKNGTGIGLYMSKMIIEEHHNGAINVENRESGVCFSIELKRKEKNENH